MSEGRDGKGALAAACAKLQLVSTELRQLREAMASGANVKTALEITRASLLEVTARIDNLLARKADQ